MRLWFLIASVTYGMLMMLDPFIYICIAYILNVNSIYLGVCSALWSFVFISSSAIFGVWSDKGKARELMILAFIFMILSWLCLANFNTITALIGYSFHALSLAVINLSINVIIFETIDCDEWGRAILLHRALSYIIRGLTFIFMAITRQTNILIIHQLTIMLIFVMIVVSPSISLISERSLYKMYCIVKELGSYLRASSSLLFVSKPLNMQMMFEKIWSAYPQISMNKIATLIMLVTAIGDYVFTVLPLVIKNIISLYDIWLVYGVASVLSPLVMITLKSINASSKSVILTLIVLRSLLLLIGMFLINNVITFMIYNMVSSTLYFIIDNILYNTFISLSSGYRSSTYYSLRELGSIVGSVLGGFIMSIRTDIYLLGATTIVLLCAILMA